MKTFIYTVTEVDHGCGETTPWRYSYETLPQAKRIVYDTMADALDEMGHSSEDIRKMVEDWEVKWQNKGDYWVLDTGELCMMEFHIRATQLPYPKIERDQTVELLLTELDIFCDDFAAEHEVEADEDAINTGLEDFLQQVENMKNCVAKLRG